MKSMIPTIHGMIDRRILVNFRIQPAAVRRWLPPLFRPKLVRGWAMGGICLIRLTEMRPRGFPARFGVASENAAHRFAVEWDDEGVTKEGVYIPRRDTSSRLQAFVGGRLFPGEHHAADFCVKEANDQFSLKMQSRDGPTSIEVVADRAAQLPGTSIFPSLAEAADFFARGSAGYSATKNSHRWDGLELNTAVWRVEPLAVRSVHSSFFMDRDAFPEGTVHFDCALLMQNIAHEWRVLPPKET